MLQCNMAGLPTGRPEQEFGSMALSQEFPSAVVAGERAGRALRLPLGVVSPLWAVYGAAAGMGLAYWWMTSWTRAVNVEALAPFASKLAAKPQPIEIAAAPEPVAAIAEAAPEPAPTLALEPPAPKTEAVAAKAVAVMEKVADDLTRMTGIGPKLSIALADLGVTRFAQIAAWTAEDLGKMDAALSLKGRAVREAWVAQAKRLAAAK
jgi:predicted flap endonuclease-1-like 5' DNA nuclease